MADINKLLKKKGWTGVEVGRLMIYSIMEASRSMGKDEPSLSQSDFDKLVHALSSQRDLKDYSYFTILYNSLQMSNSVSQGYIQQFEHGFRRLLNTVAGCETSEDIAKKSDYQPVVMTPEQYLRATELAEQHNRAMVTTFCDLIFYTMEYFSEQEDDAPDEIKEALELCKGRSASGNRYLEKYNSIKGYGYHELADGTRSDTMTQEEWHEAVKTRGYNGSEDESLMDVLERRSTKRVLTAYKLLYRGTDAIKDFYKEKTGEDLAMTDEELASVPNAIETVLTMGSSELNHPSEKLRKLLECMGWDNAYSWHTYDDVPEDTSMFDMLEVYMEVYRENGDKPKEMLTAFKEDYPELYKAIISYLEAKLDSAKGLKPSQYYDDLFTFGELADNEVIDCAEVVKPDNHIKSNILDAYLEEHPVSDKESFSLHKRAMLCGIAIMNDTPSPLLNTYLADAFPYVMCVDDIGDKVSAQSSIAFALNELIYPAVQFMYGYNALLGIIGRLYDIPDLEYVLGADTVTLDERTLSYNSILYTLHFDVYGDPEEKERKRSIIREYLPEIDLERFKPKEETIKAVEEELRHKGTGDTSSIELNGFYKLIVRLSGGEA